MKIKLNWGFGIVLFIGIFMAFILSLVYKCSLQKVDLVSADYYEKEIQYQKQINRINNSAELDQQVVISSEKGLITFQFPGKFQNSKLAGSITFFKPDDSANDFEVPLKVNSDLMQTLPTEKMVPGRWNIKLNYKDGQTEYYTEQKINLN